MLGRVAVSLIAYLLCIFKFQDSMVTVGHLLGLSGFWALFIPSALIGLSVYRIADLDHWGLWDAASFLVIGSIAMLAMTGDPKATTYELIKGVVSFSVAAILGARAAITGGRH
ncbi:hypothetical protein X802_00925 [Thermococcus guaymasensis DSM 11113]|uniref:Uncharacterized protein n=1 Tax=Thermococcus guaymasensis DSM 11113 TaxID=1432656 RepID=A0A0X1KI40_9EURY|nr:hypothetical protein [Thermococcus guaymasensis]AJC70913.1 hypothetical protein X802_00925 [Thermococcus guaymasensis DSM 11113]